MSRIIFKIRNKKEKVIFSFFIIKSIGLNNPKIRKSKKYVQSKFFYFVLKYGRFVILLFYS